MKMIVYQTAVLYFLILSAFCEDNPCNKTSTSAITRLRNNLLCNFEPKNRPTTSISLTSDVQVTLHVAFIKYDVQKARLIVNNWIQVNYFENHFKWKPEDYESVTKIDFEGDKIWLPDLSIYNKQDLSQDSQAIGTARCIATFEGNVQCLAPSQHDGICSPDLTWFPFDEQKCHLRFGSWIHSGSEVNFTLSDPPVTLDLFTPNPQWNLINITSFRDPGMYHGASFPSLGYTFLLKRHAGMIRATIVAPAIVLMLLTLTILQMDLTSSDRVNIAAFNLVCHLLYVQNIYWQIPITENKPLIVIFFRDSTLLSGILIVLTIIFKKMSENKTASPKFVNSIVSSYIGQTIGTFNYSIQIAATGNEDDEEGKTIVNFKEEERHENWIIFAEILNRITITVYCILYLIIFIKFIR